uniref:EF-hand domain-containing protein n=1 Tax=Eucampia antarctica TaxID=49252 RepID=A0A6U0Q2Q4_9STRA|mmetsp:Transcript_14586/g.14059  ORF Transcript_14586/g.14059 Transcript_14586/m.14059 type:complete len:384 (+) Transcript_14586:168-1319(+)|eukprot:CAMPEP_0197823936 /NCGR_PEP_ID=MMETSP1437-20131217/1256_1 /TAXON_ID=49252 ORGANISM="Eucampia antarctica, Strain CCMP1452" /NCGR_SAMPLE_ID=MMETSP1437 /ASSEMBLY_ACC=CAM_ASM_001096 /LENGTH=383 /DNA_ID=CAMNT_0043423357 /DNA_START=167 /DNA_END=1318 /DNA_ORIENTATION=-
MIAFTKKAALLAVILSTATAFTVPSPKFTARSGLYLQRNYEASKISTTRLRDSANSDDKDSEIERLRSMAAQLRAEASSLEAEKAQQLADVAERAFRKFDIDQDGMVSLSELKSGLEKVLKTELSDNRVKQLMESFDASGDGALQIDEFPVVDRFRNKLEALAREEKQTAADAQKQAKLEEEAAALAQARLEILNDKPPSRSDKFLSLLPYLFPLMDGLQYGRFLLEGGDGGNPFVVILAVLYGVYRSIPFSGFAAFFALSFLSGNPSLNRLVRFNMQQAIYVDIALFFPGLITGLSSFILQQAGVTLPPGVSELSYDLIFASLVLTLAYCTISSVFGIEPDKIPLISNAVKDRMPTIDMFDMDGNFVPREGGEEKDDDKSEK